MQRKCRRVAADSSSVILLQKSALLSSFLKCYRVLIAPAVMAELVSGQKDGAMFLEEQLRPLVVEALNSQNPSGMGNGESATLGLYKKGLGDFVLLDDKKAAKYCKKNNIPFVNSLLIARILHLSGEISFAEKKRCTKVLIEEGYYSTSIVGQAETIPGDVLQQFYPFTEVL